MALALRNVETSPDDPIREWPQEALATALERGGLSDWRRIVIEIRLHPWGTVARTVEEVLTYCRPYGVDLLMESAIAEARAAAVEAESIEAMRRIRALHARSGLSAAEFARGIGTSPSRMSTYLSGKVTPSAALLVRMERLVND